MKKNILFLNFAILMCVQSTELAAMASMHNEKVRQEEAVSNYLSCKQLQDEHDYLCLIADSYTIKPKDLKVWQAGQCLASLTLMLKYGRKTLNKAALEVQNTHAALSKYRSEEEAELIGAIRKEYQDTMFNYDTFYPL